MKIYKETKEFFNTYIFVFGAIGLIFSILSWNLAPILICLMIPIPLAIAYEIGIRLRKRIEKKKGNK